MTYSETVDYLFNQLPVFQIEGAGAYKPGLGNAYALSAAFGDPHKDLRTIHIAGTNGKGSTSHTIASVLMAAGYKVGLFTSPHLFDFRERIRVNGEKISEDAVVSLVERYRAMNLDVSPSFFELTTIMAFDYFRSAGVDIAVIEVGLGGRLDTTNILIPELSVITNVSLDHMAQLGDTEELIAGEKAGIIKPGVPVVVGEAQGEVREVFRKKAQEAGAPIIFAEDTPVEYKLVDDRYVYTYHSADGRTLEVVSDLSGIYQPKNMNTVFHALRLLPGISDEAIIDGMSSVQLRTGLMGRWMTIGESPRVLIDTGHNIGAWRYLAPRLAEMADKAPLRIVMGFVSDKDVTSIFELLPRNAEYYFVTPSVKRGRPSGQLLALAMSHHLKARAFDSVAEGYRRALMDSSASDTIFVGGSNYVVSELSFLQR